MDEKQELHLLREEKAKKRAENNQRAKEIRSRRLAEGMKFVCEWAYGDDVKALRDHAKALRANRDKQPSN